MRSERTSAAAIMVKIAKIGNRHRKKKEKGSNKMAAAWREKRRGEMARSRHGERKVKKKTEKKKRAKRIASRRYEK